MGIFEIIAGAVLALVCIVVIFLVLSQESKQGGMGAFSGGSENYNNMQSRSINARAAVATKYAAIGFFVITMIVNLVNAFM